MTSQLYSSPDDIRVIMWHVWGRTEMQTVLVVTLEGERVQVLGVDGRKALK